MSVVQMEIQKILFPKKEICEEQTMYFRREDQKKIKIDEDGSGLFLKRGETVSFETYFNAFSVGKWSTYTKIENVGLVLYMDREADIRLFHVTGDKEDTIFRARTTEEKVKKMYRSEEEAEAVITKTDEGYRIEFSCLYDEGILFPVITAKEDLHIFGGTYVTSEIKRRDVRISFNICTFKREAAVEKNVRRLLEDVLDNEKSNLFHRSEIYISDNGQTLDPHMFGGRGDVHILPNKNVGGAGGFTRTIIESVLYRKENPFTHVILMDDDIRFDSEVIERSYHILSLLRDEYQNANLCGSMLELENRYMQFECGAYWKGVMLKSYNHEWDLRQQKAVSANEAYNELNYGGWWYCCIPTAVIHENNLPIPMFIHYDDIEYGRRLSENGIIMMNGICVWHPYGENKQPVSMNYYDERNILIAMSGFDEYATKAKMIDHLARIITRDVMRYKYRAAETCFLGMEDFFRGPEEFMKIDPVQKHAEIAAYNYTYEDPVGYDLNKMHDKVYEDYPKWIPQAEILCHLLPSFVKLRIVSERDIGYGFFAKSVFLYDRNRKKGYLTTRSLWETMACLRRYFALRKKISSEFDETIKRWREKKSEFTNLSFWETYLEIKAHG